MEIIADTLADAHEGAFWVVVGGRNVDIQTHKDKMEKTIEFCGDQDEDDILTIKVRYPMRQPQVSSGTMFGEKFTEAYKKQFLSISPPRADRMHATYTYWNRLEDHPWTTGDSYADVPYRGDGRGDGLAQITNIIEKLSNDRNSRRAVAVTYSPVLDMDSTEPPCMCFVQFVIRNDTINMRSLFRSQDILSGLGENLVGNAALLEYVAKGINEEAKKTGSTGVKIGSLILISTIPHIYHIRDQHEFKKMSGTIQTRRAAGAWAVQIK